LTRPELAEAFGVIPGTITRWERDGMPVAKRFTRGRASLFDLQAVKAWRDAVDAKAEAEQLSLTDERAKLAQKQREKIELELAVRRGELVLRDQVIREVDAFAKGVTAKLRSLARRAAQAGIIQPDQVAGLESLCREMQEEISRWKTIAHTQGKRGSRRKDQAPA
jgi:phage terminase Nu1 subunit (DNA packaging protein)